MAHPFVIIYQINHPAIIISTLLRYSNRMMVILYIKLHFKIQYILLGIYNAFCNAYNFSIIGKWLQETISYINVRIAISKKDYIWKLFINISFILFYRSIKAIVILGIFSLFFLFVIIPFFFRWCSTLQRHMVFLPYGKIIRYICLQNCLLWC